MRNDFSPSRTATCGTPCARASAAAASALATTCGAGEARSPTAHSSAALVCRSGMNARSTSRSSTTPTMPTAGRAEGEADRAGTLDHVGLADQPLGLGVGGVVDARPLHAFVDAALVGGVVGHRGRAGVPVQVVLGEVQHHGGLGAHGPGVVELEAGELDGQDVVRRRVHHRLGHRAADVADRRAAQARGGEDRVEHLDRRGLAVGAGDAQPGGGGAGRVAQPPGELDLAPHRDAAPDGLRQQRRARLPARRGDDHVDVVGQRRGRARAEPDLGAQHLEQGRLLLVALGVLVERRDLRAEVGQVVGGGEPGDAEAGHDRTDAGPVVAAAEVLDTDHAPATHWA